MPQNGAPGSPTAPPPCTDTRVRDAASIEVARSGVAGPLRGAPAAVSRSPPAHAPDDCE
jgi:hypothetical protein